MSAPNAGRQSPEPEKQSKSQVASTASDPNHGDAASHTAAKEDSNKQKDNLPSNPKQVLEDHAAKKSGP